MNIAHRFRGIVAVGLLLAIVSTTMARYSGGTGEPNDPYRIATAQDLNDINNHEDDFDKDFVLTNDVDLSGYTGNQFNLIGRGSGLDDPNLRAFTGVFDGRGHRILNFTRNSEDTDLVGLFRCLGGTVKNVGMENVNIDAGPQSTYIGALVGWGYGKISACYSTGNIRGGDCCGGLAGFCALIVNCYSTVSITGGASGGLCGGATIVYSYSTGRVADAGYTSGGLTGMSGGVVNSFWDIETSSHLESAGGLGKTTAEMKRASTFSGWGGRGNEGVWKIDDANDYPHLAWEDRPGQPLPKQQLLDFVAGKGTEAEPYLISTAQQLNLIGVFPCEWDKHFVLTNDIDMNELNVVQFNIIGVDSPSYYFAGFFDGNNHKIWNLKWVRSGYLFPIGLFGSTIGVIENVGLENIVVNVANSYQVGALAGENFGVIRNCYSTGTIAALCQVGGLVGVSQGGEMTDCYSTAAVTGGHIVGGLVGLNRCPIRRCRSWGTVTGGTMVGGLVGVCFLADSAHVDIQECYSTSNVLGEDSVGGLVGQILSLAQKPITTVIAECYAAGGVTGVSNVGGLVGSNPGSNVVDSFWDTEFSGQTTSAGGTGKTTAEMQTAKTFLDAGWDFVGETKNGTEDIWWVDEGKDYPRLSWELPRP